MLNQPGGAGAVAIKAVAPAAPDGHTLFMSLATNFIALPQLQENFPVDAPRFRSDRICRRSSDGGIGEPRSRCQHAVRIHRARQEA